MMRRLHARPASARLATKLLALAVLGLMAGGRLLACFEPEYRSVHFHGLRPDFFQMPQPWRGVPEENRALPASKDWTEVNGHYFDPRELQLRGAIRRALRAEAAGRFRLAAEFWERYQRERQQEDPYALAEREEPPQAEALDDRLAALHVWRGPGDTPDLRLYLRARDLVSGSKYAKARLLLKRTWRGLYRRRAAYLKASLQFHSGPQTSLRYGSDPPTATVAAFQAILKQYPRDLLSLYTLGRCYFRMVRLDEELGRCTLTPDQRARLLRQAIRYYESCSVVEPDSSLTEDARGKVAACRFRLGDYVAALLIYSTQLAALPPGRDNHFAFLSARQCLRRMTLAEHRAFQAKAMLRPEVAAVYLDLHLHFGRPGLRGCENLGRFALAVLALHPNAALSGRLLTRLGVIEGRLGRWDRTERLATAAIARCGPGGYRDQARWQRAQALRQLHRRREALTEYERLVQRSRISAHDGYPLIRETCVDVQLVGI